MNVMFAGLLGLGPTELVLIVAVIFFFFGAKRLPGLAKGLGNSIKEFKRGMVSEEQPAAKKSVLVDKN